MPRCSTRHNHPVPDFRSRNPSDPSRRGRLLSLSDVQASSERGISSFVQRLGNQVLGEIRHSLQRSCTGMARQGTVRLLRSCWNSLCFSDGPSNNPNVTEEEGSASIPPPITRRHRRSGRPRREDPVQPFETIHTHVAPSPPPLPAYLPFLPPIVEPGPAYGYSVDPVPSSTHRSSMETCFPSVALEDDYFVSPESTGRESLEDTSGILMGVNTPNPSFAQAPVTLSEGPSAPTEWM